MNFPLGLQYSFNRRLSIKTGIAINILLSAREKSKHPEISLDAPSGFIAVDKISKDKNQYNSANLSWHMASEYAFNNRLSLLFQYNIRLRNIYRNYFLNHLNEVVFKAHSINLGLKFTINR